MRAVFEIDYGKIEIIRAADDFQRFAGIPCEMADSSDLRQRVGNQFFQFIVVGEQKHDWRFHTFSLVDKRIHAWQELRIAAHFLPFSLRLR
jgi:hypothetical protein